MQPYAEADAKETAKSKADEEAKAATKTNGAGKAADAKAEDKAGAKKVRSCIKAGGAPMLKIDSRTNPKSSWRRQLWRY